MTTRLKCGDKTRVHSKMRLFSVCVSHSMSCPGVNTRFREHEKDCFDFEAFNGGATLVWRLLEVRSQSGEGVRGLVIDGSTHLLSIIARGCYKLLLPPNHRPF